MEEQGVPAVAIVTTPVPQHRRGHGRRAGASPATRSWTRRIPIANLTEAELDERCDRLVEQVEEWLGFEAH